MKKYIKVATSIFLAFLIMSQSIAITAFAVDEELVKTPNETIDASEITNDIADMPDIVCEVDSKRNACKKDYLLEDGSFCSVITASPIHEYCNGRWIEKNKSAKAETIEQVVNALKTSNNSRISESEQTSTRGDNTYSESNGLIIDWADNSYSVENGTLWHTLDGDETAFYVKPAQVDQYTANGCIVKSAVFSLDCELSGTDADTYIYTWSNNYENMTISDTVYSIAKINTDSTYAYDITHLFNKWERGKEANTGFAYLDANTSNISVSNPCLVINYIDTASHSLDCTYHSVNLGSAGIIYINDVTNCFTLKQKILNYSYNNKTDLSIYRTYDSTDASINNLSGIKSTFNFESVLNVNPDYAEWTMFDGNTVSFIPSNPLVSSDGYEVWDLLPSANSANLNALLYLPATENSSLAPYTLINGLKYWFGDGGCIDRIVSVPSNDNIMSFTYKASYIEILLQDGNKYRIEKNNPNNSVSAVKLLDATNNPVTDENNIEKKTTFSFVENNNQMTNTVTFYNGDSSVYVFDAEGHLLYVSSTANNSSIRCEFEYAEYPDQSLGSYITGYELFNNNSNTAYESLTIDSDNTFKRVFTDISGKEENIYYDSNYRIVTYVGKNASRKCIDYDENGILNSYVFDDPNYYSENNDAELLNGNDFPYKNLSPWTRLTNYNGDSGNLASSSNIKRVSNPHGRTGNGVLFGLTIDNIFDISLYRDVPNTIFEADKTYVFGGEVYLDEVLSDLSRTVSISIEIAPVLNGIPSTNYTEYSKITFDNTLLNEWQYRRKAFKLEDDSVIRFKLNYSNQGGQVYFMMPTLFESSDSITDLDDLVTSSPIEYTYSNGKTTSETMIWERLNDTDLTMSTAYSYNQDGKICSYEDYNGNQTYYQYDSDGGLSGKGHSIDGQNNITDVNSLAYDAENALLSTSQIVKNVETNNNVTLSTGYEKESTTENGNVISCVTVHHNGYDQVFKYNADGMLIETYSESTSLPNDHTNYGMTYQYVDNYESFMIDYSNGYREISYKYDEDGHTYRCIECWQVTAENETMLKSYYYQFDDNGELLKSYDDSTNIMVNYESGSYSLYENDNNNPILIFSNETTSDGYVQTYSNTFYSLPKVGEEQLYSCPDTIETTPSAVSVDSDGFKTSVSTVNAEKNLRSYIMTAEYNRMSVEDYFGRLSHKETYVEHDFRDNMSGSMYSDAEYEYKDLGNGRTSGLVSEYSSTISGSFEHPNSTQPNVQTITNFSTSYSRKYEYDNRGNVTFVYVESNNSIEPKEYYEYDNANQIITEINFENRICAHYTYDSGGNLTAKIYYDYDELVFNVTNRSIEDLGNETDRITYQYDSVWKDRLININGTPITYDKMGNPLNYIGTNIEGETVSGTLEWQGNSLSVFESNKIRIEYQYDRNGFRTSKAVYGKTVTNNNTVYSNKYIVDYLWDNGILIGLIFSGLNENTEDREEMLNVNFIYDEEGSVTGYVSYLGIPYMFKKDIHDNILSLVFPDGEDLFTYSYDSWGKATATYSEYWSSDPFRLIMVKAIARLCPMAYHGYLYDYETGMCFNKGRCYSPDWGRNINPEDYEKLVERPENPLEANLYIFCNNNPLNILDKTASWNREYTGIEWKSNGFEVAMSEMFASRPICTLFASHVIKTRGTWDLDIGYNYMGMSVEDIASDLFAHYVGKYAKASINKVNAVWGDGWILNNSKSDMIFVYNEDPNLNNPNNPNEYGKYYKIWIAAPEIKVYAQKEGIFITL